MPLRDHSLTFLPRFSVIRRKPSHLVSKTHSLLSKGSFGESGEHRSVSRISCFFFCPTKRVHCPLQTL